jgi:hypothetical protein
MLMLGAAEVPAGPGRGTHGCGMTVRVRHQAAHRIKTCLCAAASCPQCCRVLRCCRLCCGGCCRPSDRSGGGAALASVSSGRPLAEGVDETSHTQQQPLLDVEQGGGSAAAAASGGAVADSGSGGGCSTSAGGSSSGSGCHVCARPLHAPDADAAVVRESDKDAGAAAGPAWLHQRLRLGNTWLWGQGAAAAAAGSTAASTAAPAIDGQVQQQPSVTTGLWSDEGGCSALCGGQWGESHVPKLPPLTASQRLTNEAIMQVWLARLRWLGLCGALKPDSSVMPLAWCSDACPLWHALA